MSLKNFEIVDDNFYKDFIERKNIIHRNKIMEIEMIINNGKIILFSDNNKIILIGHIINDNYLYNKFINDIFLNSVDGKYIKLISAAFKRMNYINAINDERLNKKIFIHYFDESLKPKISNEIKDKNDNSDIINLGKNILKLFIILYLHYEELNENINKEIKSNSNEKYFLINGEFIKKYKEHYNYH